MAEAHTRQDIVAKRLQLLSCARVYLVEISSEAELRLLRVAAELSAMIYANEDERPKGESANV